jgi:hypothetical protein
VLSLVVYAALPVLCWAAVGGVSAAGWPIPARPYPAAMAAGAEAAVALVDLSSADPVPVVAVEPVWTRTAVALGQFRRGCSAAQRSQLSCIKYKDDFLSRLFKIN